MSYRASHLTIGVPRRAKVLRSFLLHDMAKKRQIYKYLKILKFNQKKQQNDKTYDI